MEQKNKLFKVAEVQLTYKPTFKAVDRPKITKAHDAYPVLLDSWDRDQISLIEEFKILLLNRRNNVLGIAAISKGGVSETVVDAKVIFSIALKCCASGVILCHNHPSGELFAGKEDVGITTKLKAAGKLLDIQVLDHLIISKDGFYSFADAGMM